jgi:hypothetical protein
MKFGGIYMLDISGNYAWVNRSDSLIPVWDSLVLDSAGFSEAGGNQIGNIYSGEFWTCRTNTDYEGSDSKVHVLFRNSAGAQTWGYVQIRPYPEGDIYDWVNYQEPYHYYNSNGSSLVGSTSVSINGTAYRQFSLSRAVTVRAISGSVYSTLNPDNTLIATNTSHTGDNYSGYMEFQKIKIAQGNWANLCGTTYGYVDLDLAHGSMPSNRSVL